MRKGFIMSAFILIVVGILVGGLAVFVYFQLKPKEPAQIQQVSQTSPSAPSTQPAGSDETLSWKSYSGKFSNFKYPQNWHIKELSQPDILLIQEKETDSTGIAFGVGKDYQSSYDGVLKYEVNKVTNQVGETGNYTLTRLPNISIDGNAAVVVELKPESIGLNKPLKEVYISRNNVYYKMWVSGNNQAEFDNNQKIFGKILSTFKFN